MPKYILIGISIPLIVILIMYLFQYSTIFSQEIEKNIFGFATSNTFTFCSITDTSFTNKVQALNPQVLRFPGGAVGNFYDRVDLNAVPDFIDLHYQGFHWFIFNVADIFITIGVICLIYDEVFLQKSENEK